MLRAIFFLIMFVPSAVLASEKPPEMHGVIQSKKPYGTGVLHRWGFTIYEASFWADQKPWRPAAPPYALNIHYDWDISREDLVALSVEEIERIDRPDKESLQRYAKELERVFPDVKKGDTITAMCTSDGTVRFYHNARLYGEVKQPGFAEPFFNIWLHPETKWPDLRKGLLQASNE